MGGVTQGLGVTVGLIGRVRDGVEVRFEDRVKDRVKDRVLALLGNKTGADGLGLGG